MNVVLISNAPTPSICEKIGIKSSPKEGWVTGLVNSLKKRDITIHFVFPHRINKELLMGETDEVFYYGYPKTKDKDWEYELIHKQFFMDIFNKIETIDVIHIMGTEMGHALSAVEAAEEVGILDKVVISIQGMTSVYAEHYYAGLPNSIVKKFTIRDFIKRDNIELGKQIFEKRGKYETAALKKVKHVIGRTDWDKACTYFINPDARYHFCNETLRDTFYTGQWKYEECDPYTIFVSQGGYPIKGFHYMLEALKLVKNFYPNVKLKVTGSKPNRLNFWMRQKRTSYSNYIESLIRNYDLENNVEFVGLLNAEEMKEQYLHANVFVSPSSIENSPNSVGEAMILGTPVITSDVGGVKNLLEHGEEGYIYQCDAPYMLAYYIIRIFADSKRANELSSNARTHAAKTHSPVDNSNQMWAIYCSIAKNVR